jgi:hypothetical protein
MAIDVTCAACKTRFQVSEKFAGKSGPCPKCKATIKIPEKKDQVVIHGPDESATKTATGQPIFKPILRKEVRLSPLQIGAIVGAVLGVLLATFVFRIAFGVGQTPVSVLILGAIALAPPLAFAGYTFLREDELAPHRGTELLLRLIAPSIVYPGLWALYWFVFWQLSDVNVTPNWYLAGPAALIMVAIGAVTAQASLELELGAGALHYSLYLIVTIILRVILVGSDQILWLNPVTPAAKTALLQLGEFCSILAG